MTRTLARFLAGGLLLAFAARPFAVAAQECPAPVDPPAVAAVASAVEGSAPWWQRALRVTDGVAGVAGLGVGVAALAGVSAPVIPIAGVAIGAYFATRAIGDLVERGLHGRSIDPLRDAEARGDWLGLAAGAFGVGELATGARMIGSLQATRVLGVSGMVAGLATMPDAVIGLVRGWDRLGGGQRGLALAQVGLVAVTLGHEPFRAPPGMVEVRGPAVARYAIDGELGSGAFGKAYVGHDAAGAKVTVKVARPGDANQQILLKEAGALASVDGTPELQQILGVGRDAEGNPAVVMAYAPGAHLAPSAATMARPGLSVRIIRKVLRGVVGLNAAGRRHGDLHYGNVLIAGDDPATVKVIDLGMADPLAEPHPWGKGAFGTRDYHQTTGDEFAAGTMLLDMLTGVGGMDLVHTSHGQLQGALARVQDPGLRAVIARAIDPYPANRYPTTQDFFDALAPYESLP